MKTFKRPALPRPSTAAEGRSSPRTSKRSLNRNTILDITPIKNPAATAVTLPSKNPQPVQANPSPACKRSRLHTTLRTAPSLEPRSPLQHSSVALNTCSDAASIDAKALMNQPLVTEHTEQRTELGEDSGGLWWGGKLSDPPSSMRQPVWDNPSSPSPPSGDAPKWDSVSFNEPMSADVHCPMVSFGRVSLSGVASGRNLCERKSSNLRRSLLSINPMRLSLDPSGAVHMSGAEFMRQYVVQVTFVTAEFGITNVSF